MTTKVKPTVEKWEEILKKAEEYVRKNSVYYGNDQYRLSMTDWLYFIKGVASEVEAHSVQEAKAEMSLGRNWYFEGDELVITRGKWVIDRYKKHASLKQEEEK